MKANDIAPDAILSKIRQLTTPLGIYQFGIKDQPDPSYGYALDDQVRALLVADTLGEERLKKIYLEYIERSKRPDGLLFQFADDKGRFTDNTSPEATRMAGDAYGETVWALGQTKAYQIKSLKPIFEKLLDYLADCLSPRPMAYSLIGLASFPEPSPLEKEFTERLKTMFRENSTLDWAWFEDGLYYGNGVIPWALWEVALARQDEEAKEIAQKATDFLYQTCQIKGRPAPIGSEGWHQKGGKKAVYIQQPICAGYMNCCLEKAYQATKKQQYKDWAGHWWNWFWGENILSESLISENFACFDGITESGLNPNHGAESSICFILAWLSAKRMNL